MNAGLPANISIAQAKLPQAYESAKLALANCARIDECQEWADKAEALASYAKQADDDTLRQMADRIQARAVRRCGELLKQFDGRGRPSENSMGTHTISRREAAESAGLSKHQTDTAARVANVPEQQFETAIEAERPATVTQLAEMGKATRAAPSPMPERPEGFKAATHLIGTVECFAQFCADNNPEIVAAAVMSHEAKDVRAQVARIDAWLDRFVVNLKE